MWSRRTVVTTLLRSIALSRQLQSYPQFSIFCDACQIKINRCSRQYHSSSKNLGKKFQHTSDDDDLDDGADDDDDEEDSVRFKYQIIKSYVFSIHLHERF